MYFNSNTAKYWSILSIPPDDECACNSNWSFNHNWNRFRIYRKQRRKKAIACHNGEQNDMVSDSSKGLPNDQLSRNQTNFNRIRLKVIQTAENHIWHQEIKQTIIKLGLIGCAFTSKLWLFGINCIRFFFIVSSYNFLHRDISKCAVTVCERTRASPNLANYS